MIFMKGGVAYEGMRFAAQITLIGFKRSKIKTIVSVIDTEIWRKLYGKKI